MSGMYHHWIVGSQHYKKLCTDLLQVSNLPFPVPPHSPHLPHLLQAGKLTAAGLGAKGAQDASAGATASANASISVLSQTIDLMAWRVRNFSRSRLWHAPEGARLRREVAMEVKRWQRRKEFREKFVVFCSPRVAFKRGQDIFFKALASFIKQYPDTLIVRQTRPVFLV